MPLTSSSAKPIVRNSRSLGLERRGVAARARWLGGVCRSRGSALRSLKWRGAGAEWPRASMTTRRRAPIAEEVRTTGARRVVTIRSDVSSIATRWQLSTATRA
ncbi:hypothetical protein T492DRAFT_1008997, partial [Pavlovales sp. CCMP2436]